MPPMPSGVTVETLSARAVAPAAVAPTIRTVSASWDSVIKSEESASAYKFVLYWSPLLYGDDQWREIGRYDVHIRQATVTVPWSDVGQFGITMAFINQ